MRLCYFSIYEKVILGNSEGHWVTLGSKLKKDAIFEAVHYQGMIILSWVKEVVPGHCYNPTPKAINLDNPPITQKCKCSLWALYFDLSYWAAFKLIKATWPPNRHWPDSMASIQVTQPHRRKTSWHPMHQLYNLQVTIYLHSLSYCSPI